MNNKSCWGYGLVLGLIFVTHAAPTLADYPTVPAEYQSLYNELLNTDLPRFTQLANAVSPTNPPLSSPMFGGQLNPAQSLNGPVLLGQYNLAAVAQWLSDLKAFGSTEATFHVDFPLLSWKFYNWSGHPCTPYNPVTQTGGCADLLPYITYFQTVATMARSLGIKLVIESLNLLDGDGAATLPPNEQAYWAGLGLGGDALQNFYRYYYATNTQSPNVTQYGIDRGDQVAIIGYIMSPAYLTALNEPDSEARDADNMTAIKTYAGSLSLLQNLVGEYRKDQAAWKNFPPTVKLGAGVGTWITDNVRVNNQAVHYTALDYCQNFTSTPGTSDGTNPLQLDYVDLHMLPMIYNLTGTYPVDLFGQADSIASYVNAATGYKGKRMALGVTESWAHKESYSDFTQGLQTNVTNYRDNFDFFMPVDQLFLIDQVVWAKRWGFDFVTSSFPQFLNSYVSWNSAYPTQCASLPQETIQQMDADSDWGDIVSCGSQVAQSAMDFGQASQTGSQSYSARFYPSNDSTAPPTPVIASGSASPTSAFLWWNGANASQQFSSSIQDNVGTYFYSVKRNGIPLYSTLYPTQDRFNNWTMFAPDGQATPSPFLYFQDSNVTIGQTYIYSITAYDLAGNASSPASISVTIPK